MSVPSVRDLIPRASVVEALCSAVDSHSLIAIQGPAGYGKTCLCALAVAATRAPTAWYAAQPWQTGDFVDALVSEVRSVREDFGRLTLALASSGRPASNDAEQLRLWAQRVGATFAQELGHIRERLILVIEDYHVLEGDLALSDFVTGAMRHLPDSVTMLLVGRSTPSLPLAEWIAQGRALAFGAHDLKFSAMETMLLAQKHGVDLDERAASELCAQCEGWPAGISLLVGNLTKSNGSHEPSHSPRTSHLIEEHVANLPRELIDFLEQTATLEVLDVSLLEQRGGMSETRRLVKELERRGEMLTVLRPGETYRLHPLMRETIIERVREREGEAGVASRHAWAGGMLEAAGRYAPALFQLERSRDEGRLARFLASHAGALFADGHGEQVAKAVRELTMRGIDEPVLVGRVQGMLLRQRGLPGARELFRSALKVAEQRGDGDSTFALRVLLLWDALDSLDPAAASDVGDFVREVDALSTQQKATSLVLQGWIKTISADFLPALEKAAAAAELGAASPELRFRAALLYAYAATCLGDFDLADAKMSELLRDLELSEHVVLLCYTLFWYARLSLLWGDPNAAADYARQGTTLGRHLNLHAEIASVYDALAEINAAAGEQAGCLQAIEVVREYAAAAWYSADRARLAAHAQQSNARCEFVNGDPERALRTVRAAIKNMKPASALRAAMQADAALYAAFAQNPDAPAALAEATGQVISTVPFDLVDAALLASAGALLALAHAVAPEGPVAALRELPAAAKYHKYIESRDDLAGLHELGSVLHRLATGHEKGFADDADALAAGYAKLKRRGAGFEAAVCAALVRSLAQHRSSVAAALGATRLLFTRAGAGPSAEHPVPRGASLTKREAEVLSLVALGYTNKEIAQRLALSRRTVETHVERVLGKLNAASRTRAVAEAVRAGLIPATAWGASEDEYPA